MQRIASLSGAYVDVLTAIAFLHGLVTEELDYYDRNYEVRLSP